MRVSIFSQKKKKKRRSNVYYFGFHNQRQYPGDRWWDAMKFLENVPENRGWTPESNNNAVSVFPLQHVR